MILDEISMQYAPHAWTQKRRRRRAARATGTAFNTPMLPVRSSTCPAFAVHCKGVMGRQKSKERPRACSRRPYGQTAAKCPKARCRPMIYAHGPASMMGLQRPPIRTTQHHARGPPGSSGSNQHQKPSCAHPARAHTYTHEYAHPAHRQQGSIAAARSLHPATSVHALCTHLYLRTLLGHGPAYPK